MKKKIVTISRQYGSGGRYIGENLAKAMGVPCYDEKLIDMVAKESGFAQSFVAEKGERMTGSLLFNIASSLSFANNVFSTNNGVTLQDEIYFTQNRIIKELADKGPCVIVGRCADYALEDFDNCISVYVHAPFEDRIKRIENEYGIPNGKSKEMLMKKDKQRSSYYNYYSSNKWGDAKSYDLCLNSSYLGIDGSVDLIKKIIAMKESEK